MLVRNQYPRTKPRVYRLVTLEKLLVESMEICQLNQQARKVFKNDGTIVKSVDDVAEKETLYISMGEAFGYGVTSPARLKKPPPPPSPPTTESPKVDDQSALKTAKPRKDRVREEILSFNRIVAASTRTVQEAMKESTASVFAALDRPQQLKIPQMLSVHDDCQQQMLSSHLLRLSICPHGAEVLPESTQFAQMALHHLATGDIKLVIGGPRQSGKTTLLYQLSSVLCRKLQLSNEVSTFLFFPFNFELVSFALGDCLQLLRLFIANAFEAVEYSSLKLLPYLEPLRKWFVVCVFGSSIAPPQEVATCGFFNVSDLTRLAHSLKLAIKDDGDHSLRQFIELLCAFPNAFARAVGLRGAIYIIDGFEFSQVVITPSETLFRRSLEEVCLSDVLSAELNKSIFIVSMKEEQKFFESFACADAAFIGTQGLIKVPDAQDDELIVHDPLVPINENPGLRLRLSQCLGCPGFVAVFKRIAAKAKAIRDNAAIPSPWAIVRSSTDVSRSKIARFELLHLLQLLAEAEAPAVSAAVVGRVQESKSLTVKLFTGEERVAQAEPPDGPTKNKRPSSRTEGIDMQMSGFLTTLPPT
jgi:hypothetical protein